MLVAPVLQSFHICVDFCLWTDVCAEEIIAAYFKIMQEVQIWSCLIKVSNKIREYNNGDVSALIQLFEMIV